MKTKILLKGPLLTRSGYGEQTRFAYRALKSRPDLFDVYVQPLSWGNTSWLNEASEERDSIDKIVEKTIGFIQQGAQFDASLQCTIPNEWEPLAPVNIGYTAGIETTKTAHQWLQKGNMMNRMIVVSTHSKIVFENTQYGGEDEAGNRVELRNTTPIDVVNYPVKKFGALEPLDVEFKDDFNFLVMAQAGPRKNLGNTLKWFLEEFQNDEVGLVIKTNMAKNCLMDREHTLNFLKQTVAPFPDRKCSLYLLHGDMTDEEIHALFEHPQITSLLTLSHGEGFGLPIFEGAYTGIPVVAPGWSGQLDFLVDKESGESHFYNIEYDLQPVSEAAHWEGVIVPESMWAYPREHSAKQQMRRCYHDFTSEKASEIQEKTKLRAIALAEEFSEAKLNAQMVASVCAALGIDPDAALEDEVVEFD